MLPVGMNLPPELVTVMVALPLTVAYATLVATTWKKPVLAGAV
jgi:hypothetical protein